MALVCYSASMTMHIGAPTNNEYLKVALEVKDVDTEVDFNEQIQKIHATYHQLAAWAEDQIGNKIQEALQKESL